MAMLTCRRIIVVIMSILSSVRHLFATSRWTISIITCILWYSKNSEENSRKIKEICPVSQ